MAVLRGLSSGGEVFLYTAYAERLAPILNLAALCGLELCLWLALLRSPDLSKFRSLLNTAILVWALFGLAAAFIFLTKIGLTYDVYGSFGLPAVPLLEWQLLLAWLAGLTVMMLAPGARLPRIRHLDLWIALIIWAATSALWLSQPVNPAYFATPPRAPNFEIYPFSDALNYAVEAQSILIGNGMTAFFYGIPPRPFYIEFLAWLHALAGQDYASVIALQSLVLAFFPASLYLVGKELAGRKLGIPIAMLAALRDVTSNQAAPFSDNITYSKLFFSELPVALLLVIFILLVIRWMKDPSRAGVKPAIAGGVLGLAMLIRTQSVVLILVTLLLALVIFRGRWKKWLGNFGMLSLVLVVTIAPWLWRNAQVSGGLVFDHPATQTMVLAQRFNDGRPIPQLEGESLSQYSNRLMRISIQAMIDEPVESTRLILGHFFNNQIDNLLLFPLRSDLDSLSELAVPTRAFWQDLPDRLTPGQAALIAAYLLVLGLGIAAAWRRAGWIGLFPLAANLAYNLWTSIFRSSGGRFLVSMDWTIYLYGMLGLLMVTHFIAHFLAQARDKEPAQDGFESTTPPPTRYIFGQGTVLAGILFFGLGCSLPLSERLVPKLYTPEAQSALQDRMLDRPFLAASGVDPAALKTLTGRAGMQVLVGRAVYPRYYASGDGEPKTAKLGYEPSPQPRLLFYLLGDVNRLVILEAGAAPAFFPHLADVVVVGIDRGTHIEAYLVSVETQTGSAAYFD